MKSYFSKLASRATLVNVQVAAPIHAQDVPDPFETTVTVPGTTPRNTARQTNQPAAETPSSNPGPAFESLSKAIDLHPPQVESRIKQTVKSPSTVEQLSIESARASDATVAIPLTPALPTTRKVTRPEPHDSEQTSINKPTELSSQTERASDIPPRNASKDQEKLELPDGEQLDKRLAYVEDEQAILLRKADSFMANLFARHSSKHEETESEEDDSQPHATRSESQIQTTKKLQPPTTPARVSEPLDETPSLVIGKLSVEVIPPPAPVVTPQRQVVVIGGGQRARAGVPSAHRFGFNRF